MFKYSRPPLFLVIFVFLTFPVYAQAPDLIGEIEIEQEQKEGMTYAELQDSVIDYFGKISKTIDELPNSSFSRLPALDSKQNHFLAAVYLNCTLQKGACPEVLEGLLEAELINSKLAGKASCPNMLQLWKSYIDFEGDRRLEFNLKVSHLNKAQDFKKNSRPRYIKCQSTINSILKHSSDSANFLSTRYVSGSAARQNVSSTLAYLNYVKENIPNIFTKTKTRPK